MKALKRKRMAVLKFPGDAPLRSHLERLATRANDYNEANSKYLDKKTYLEQMGKIMEEGRENVRVAEAELPELEKNKDFRLRLYFEEVDRVANERIKEEALKKEKESQSEASEQTE